jgi:tetratricopeptide (TPR) repeat protein
MTLATGVCVLSIIGLTSDLNSLLPERPCWMQTESPLGAAYNIAVGDPVVARATDGEVDASLARDVARTIGDSLEQQLSAKLNDPGLVGVGGLCGDGVSDGDGDRHADLEKVRKKLNGDIAISLVLHPHPDQTRVHLQLAIGGDRLGEAAELAGFSDLGQLDLGALSIASPTELLLTTAAKQMETYVELLRAVHQYSTQQYSTATETLEALLEGNLEPRTRRLALVLIGNTHGRLGDLTAARKAYHAALDDGSYPRARLGLAEIAYQRGLGAGADGDGPGADPVPCLSLRTAERRALADAYAQYKAVAKHPGAADVPDVDARAQAGMGRVETCRLLAGDASRGPAAVAHHRFVIDRHAADRRRAWLRTPAAEAYGLLGAIDVALQGDPAHAEACYRRAADLAPADRAALFADAADALRDRPGRGVAAGAAPAC